MMFEDDGKEDVHLVIRKSLLNAFRELFCRQKGDLSIHIENAMRVYMDYVRKGVAHTHIKLNNTDVSSEIGQEGDINIPCQNEQPVILVDAETASIVQGISSMATTGGRLPKSMLTAIVSRITNLKDYRSISARLSKLESLGIIKRVPELRNVYEIINLNVKLR
uniref:Uncharacterized protein n=1 Tax=Ignisphaera aggregans TaxID=334771 RepID=A0A7J3JQT4_9CREN